MIAIENTSSPKFHGTVNNLSINLRAQMKYRMSNNGDDSIQNEKPLFAALCTSMIASKKRLNFGRQHLSQACIELLSCAKQHFTPSRARLQQHIAIMAAEKYKIGPLPTLIQI